MNLAELFKKNIVMIPVVVSILVGTVINLTDTINSNKDEIIALQEVEITNLKRDLKVVQEANTELKQRLGRAEATWEMAENLYRELAEKVRDMAWDIKDLNRDVNGN